MVIYYENRVATVCFGADLLKKALAAKNIFYVERPISEYTVSAGKYTLIASLKSQGISNASGELEDEGYEIAVSENGIYLTGKDHKGIMYGMMDIAETVEFYGLDAIKSKVENPFLKLRGTKYNLPYEPYAMGDPFIKNVNTCLDMEYWREYLDFLARNRYNCLSLWSEHPFHMMFRLEKYPETCPYTDAELEKYKDVYKFIMSHAKDRGIDVYLITWNIRITKFVAKGLGLPEETGDMEKHYDIIYDRPNGLPNNSAEFYAVRQKLPVIKDYFKECIKTLAITYKDLKGIGTNCAEEMVGDSVERQNWVMDSYLEGVKESGRDLDFIMRTNMGNGKIAKIFMDQYPSKNKFISWKYSNAHMYSSVKPQFERLWGAWEGVDMNDVKVLYTVRNDDINTLRWGDPDYIRDYFKGMKKPFVQGYYWGSDGYVWGEDFQHVPHGHKMWKYDFERHWQQFELLGRLGYNPGLPEEIWVEKYKRHYGKQWGEKIFTALKSASKIIPAVTRLFWINYDFQWHPESLLSSPGFKTVVDFMNSVPMPEVGTIGIRQFVEGKIKGDKFEGETPDDITGIIRNSADTLGVLTKELRNEIPADYLGGDLVCTLLDLEAWKELGEYYFNKFTAAALLVNYENTGDTALRERALECLNKGVTAWKELGSIWSQHYMPYKMARVGRIFGFTYYLDHVRRDIELAANIKPKKS